MLSAFFGHDVMIAASTHFCVRSFRTWCLDFSDFCVLKMWTNCVLEPISGHLFLASNKRYRYHGKFSYESRGFYWWITHSSSYFIQYKILRGNFDQLTSRLNFKTKIKFDQFCKNIRFPVLSIEDPVNVQK